MYNSARSYPLSSQSASASASTLFLYLSMYLLLCLCKNSLEPQVSMIITSNLQLTAPIFSMDGWMINVSVSVPLLVSC